MPMNETLAQYRAVKAHERRWGASLMPIIASTVVVDGKTLIRTEDIENNTMILWDFSAWRIRRVAERGL